MRRYRTVDLQCYKATWKCPDNSRLLRTHFWTVLGKEKCEYKIPRVKPFPLLYNIPATLIQLLVSNTQALLILIVSLSSSMLEAKTDHNE